MKQGQKLTETTGNVTKTRGFQKGQKLTETTPKSELDIFVSETLSNPDKVFKQSVTGNPIPHVNPTVSTEETAKAAEKYAKEATAGDGYENYSLEELRKKFEVEDELYNGTDTSYGYKGNPISNTLDFIGRNNVWKEQQKAISDYKALKKAYENRRAAYTEYKTSNENYTENAEDAIKKLKERKNKAESEEEKKDIDNEIKEIRQGLYGDGNVLTSIGKGAKSGADSLLKAVASTGDFLFGNLAKALGFKNNIFSSTNQYYGQKYDESKREAQRSSAAWGDKYNISGQVSEGVTAALPDALLAIITGGSSATSKVGQLGQAAHSLTYGTAIKNAIKSTAENPFYWTSFARELGTDYEEAIESGASEAEATAYALLTASVNAAVEIGGDTGAGGIQTLPEALKETNGKKEAVMEWVKSALEEGNEEVIQGIISNLTAGAVYDKDKELFSLENEDAVINPKRMLKEGAMGAAVGGILGGGQMTFQNIVNASANSEYKKIGKTVKIVNSTDEVINYAKHSVDPEIRALALKSDPSKVSDEVAGRLYAYACRDINQAINSPESLNVAIDNFNEIAENSDDGFITSIASSQIIRRLMSAGIDEDSARYMTEQSNLNSTEPTGTDVNTTGTDAELAGAEGATEAEDDNSVLHDPEIGDIATKLDMFDTYKGSDGEQHMKTSRHKHIESAVEKTGAKLIWSSNVSRGKYIPSTKTIMLNPEMNTAEAYNFVLKHEFTHYLESKKGYDGFKDYVFNNSQFFDDWARNQLDDMGIDSTGSKKQVMERLTEAYYNKWVNSNELSEYLRKKFTSEDAVDEILADFVGENLLGTKEKLDDTLHMLSDLKQKNRSIFEKIRDFIRDLIHKFKGDKSFKGLVNDLEYLNDRLERLAQSEENKKASASEGDVKYSFAGEKAKTADKALLESAKERIENGEDSETVRRETGWFKGYDGKWRFEISDREAELNDKPDFEVKGDNSSGFYRVATLDEVLKHEDLLKAYPELKDYTVIVQETNPGTRGSFFAGDHQIVLSNTLFRKESEKYKNSVNEKYEEIRKIEQSPEFKEYNKFYDDRELAKIDAEQWLVLEEEAKKKFYSSEIGKRYYKLKWGKSEVPRYELGWSEAAKSVLMHEIQHAVQDIEGFAGGSSREYWGNKLLKDAYKKTTKAREKLFETKSDSDLAEIVYLYEEYIDRLGRNGKISSSEFAKAYDKFEKEIIGEEAKEAFLDFSEAVENYYQLKSEIPAKSSSMYMRTAGELEARDVSSRLDMTAEERKNTRPDIDRTDVVFADGGVSYSFNGDNISDNDSKQVINIIRNNINKISDKTVFNEKSVDIRNYDKKSDYVLDVFNKQGNVAINKVIGKIELVKSGAKSTMLHGYGKNKIAAIPAIKTIIENGDIISYTKNYTDYYDRYVIAAKGIIDGKPAVVGVVINSYNNNGSNKFYLHEVEIIEAESSSMTGSQNSEDTVNNSASNNKISQSDTVVKNNISENTEKYSENAQNADEKHSIPVTETAKLLDKYDKGEITREEYYEALDRRTSEEAKKAAEKYIADWEKKNGALMRRTIEANEIRAEAVANERKEQAIREDRKSSIYFIRRSVKRLDRALRANSKAKHIPESLKGAVTEFCKLFAENDTATFERKDLAEITSYYKQFGEEKTDRTKYDPFILASLESLENILPGKKLTELGKHELEAVRNIADAMNNAVKEEEAIFLDGKRAKLEEAGDETLKAIKIAKSKFPKLKTDYFFVGNAKPFYFFKNMPGPLGKVFQNFLDGQDKYALNMDYSRGFIEDTKAKYEYDTWKNQTLTLEMQSGKTYTITVEQALQLVATADRQRANEVQAAEHLNVGGVLFDTELLEKVYKAQRRVKKAEKSKEQKGLKAAKAELTRAVEKLQGNPIQLTFADINKLSKKLTDKQKDYMKAFVDFLSTECAAWGNEVTMEMYGYRQYNEANYFPYVSAKEFLYTDPTAGDSNALRHASFTNSLQRHADNPLVISSFTDVAVAHIEQMASYNAMTAPVESLNKLFNYKTEAVAAAEGNEGIPSRSVKNAITNKFGEAAADYIENFIRDVNNGVTGNSRDSFVNTMISKFKKTAVLGNLSVVIQQPFAVIRACVDLDFKYMLSASKYNSKNNYEEMKQFAPVAIIKQMGSFDTGVGLKTSTWLSGEQTFMESLDEILGKGAEKADEVAWSFLWSACKAEIASTTNLEVGSEEFLKAAGKRASDLINRTQVYDSVLSKSQNMRNKGLGGALTSFMGEPTTVINMAYDTFTDFVQGKVSGKKVVRTTTALLSSSLLTAMAKSLVYAMRDDDEDESFPEKWVALSVSNFIGDLNPLGQIPFIRDIFSIWDGYDVERQDITLVANVVTAVKSLTTGEPSFYKVRKLAEAVAALFGVPAKNILRDIEATVRTFLRMFDDNPTTAEGIKESLLEGISESSILSIFTGKSSE